MDILATSSIVQSFTPNLDQGIRQQSQFSWQGIVCGERQWNDNIKCPSFHFLLASILVLGVHRSSV